MMEIRSQFQLVGEELFQTQHRVDGMLSLEQLQIQAF